MKTPYYLIDEARLERNLKTLARVRRAAGVKILLAQKAFSCYALYPLVAQYLDGTTASGVYEARLAHEEMPGKENHVFNPAFDEDEMRRLVRWCDHIVFNSVAQWKRFRKFFGARASCPRKGGATATGASRPSPGLRVNHGYSEIEHAIYDPCRPGSRLGVTRNALAPGDLDGLEGLHFHSMCEQGADVLARTLPHFERQFGEFLGGMKWVNFGGGHHITKKGYDIPLLVRTLKAFKRRHPHLDVYLEPGEAVALNAGELVTRVKEIRSEELEEVRSEELGVRSCTPCDRPMPCGEASEKLLTPHSSLLTPNSQLLTPNSSLLTPNVILDASAECHMPDVLAMPYRPPLKGAIEPGGTRAPRPNGRVWTYRLGGPTCLAGDIIGEYTFARPLKRGDILRFGDMAIYSMVKNNTFNGIPLPAIAIRRKSGAIDLLKTFSYADFKRRL